MTNDIVFKVLFASNTEESRIALTGLLEAILERPIESLKIIHGEITNKNQLSKKTQFDIAVRFQDGELVDLEMQAFPQLDDLGARALFYGSRLLQSQDVKGKSYSCLVNSYVILLLDYCLLKDEEIIHVFRMQDDQGKILSDGMKKLKILSIEMPKLKPKEIDKLNPIESWICLLETYHVRSKNDIMKLTKKPVKGLLEMSHMADKISDDWVEEINRILDERAEYESSLEYKLAVARDIGKKKDDRKVSNSVS